MRRLTLLLAFLLEASLVFPQPAPAAAGAGEALRARLKAIPGVEDVTDVSASVPEPRPFAATYDLAFRQPLDHRNPAGPTFLQHVFVSHAGFDRPVLLATEGYAARLRPAGEMQRILGGNVVMVEHRFFGRSVPSPVAWQYLTVRQSADDLHAVVTALKAVYPGKWVSSGASKGGQTALFFKCWYPDDVDATVAYVAPVNLAQEDPRVNAFVDTVGDEATRKRIADFQVALFDREAEVLPLVEAEAARKHWTFGMGLAAAFEYGVLEYQFAFWQYGSKPAEIPAPGAPAAELAAHFNRVGTLYYYADEGRRQFEPFMYQAFTEIGYYNYDITVFRPHMKVLKDPSNIVLCPAGAAIAYNPATMAFVYDFLRYKADRVIYIYGELDAWSATRMQLIGHTDALEIVVRDSHHGARVEGFSPEQKDLFYKAMERWLGLTPARL